MANENRINQHWKKGLEDEAALPGEGLQDKAAAWQKLRHRLQQPSRKKRITWYWAAACLLLMIMLPFTFLHHNNTALVKNTVLQNAVKTAPKQLPSAKKPASNTITAVMPSAVKERAVKKAKTISLDAAVIEPSSSINNNQEDSTIDSMIPPVADSFLATPIAAVQQKKQLKVVHINELGDPVPEPQVLTHNTELHSFRLQIANEEVFTNTTAAFYKSRFAAITIKTSPTN